MLRAAAASAALAVTAAAPPDPASVLADMQAANSYFATVTAKGQLGDCGWERGTYWAGNAEHYDVSANATLLARATAWAQSWGYACKNSTNANDQICGEAYRRMYELAPSPDKLGLDVVLGQMVSDPGMVEE